MPGEMHSRRLRELSSEHIGEAQLGDVMKLGCAVSDKSFYICGEKEKPVFRIKMLFE